MTIEKGPQIEHVNEFDIGTFFHYENQDLKRYSEIKNRLDREKKFSQFGTEYSEWWGDLVAYLNKTEQYKKDQLTLGEKKDIKDYFHDKLAGLTLIDLGCGTRMENPTRYGNTPKMLEVIREFNIDSYVGIESLGQKEIKSINGLRNGFFMSGHDMLLTLARANTDSANM